MLKSIGGSFRFTFYCYHKWALFYIARKICCIVGDGPDSYIQDSRWIVVWSHSHIAIIVAERWDSPSHSGIDGAYVGGSSDIARAGEQRRSLVVCMVKKMTTWWPLFERLHLG